MRVCASKGYRPTVISHCARRLAWVSITPLGAAVDPEVYWRYASVSFVHVLGGAIVPAPASAPPAARRWCKDHQGTSIPSIASPSASTAAAAALSSTDRSRGNPCLSRVGSSAGTGTATRPLARQAQNATTKSRPAPNASATRSPPWVCIARACATCATRAWSSDQVRVAATSSRLSSCLNAG